MRSMSTDKGILTNSSQYFSKYYWYATAVFKLWLFDSTSSQKLQHQSNMKNIHKEPDLTAISWKFKLFSYRAKRRKKLFDKSINVLLIIMRQRRSEFRLKWAQKVDEIVFPFGSLTSGVKEPLGSNNRFLAVSVNREAFQDLPPSLTVADSGIPRARRQPQMWGYKPNILATFSRKLQKNWKTSTKKGPASLAPP